MEQRRRDALTTRHSETGSIVAELQNCSKEPVPNDGINEYGNIRIKPISSGPFSSSDEIELPLVSTNFDVMEFENTYIHLKTRVAIRCVNPPQVSGSDAFAKAMGENQFVMIGLKASPHIIRDYQFKFNGTPIATTMQGRAITESFLYSTFKAKSELANKKFVFSPYEEVSVMDNSLCGIYVPISDLKNETVYKTVDVIIPLKELLAMEDFDIFPNKIFGELRLVFHVSTEAFVYTEVNPRASIRKAIISGKLDKSVPHLSEVLALDPDSYDYQHSFEQIGIPSAVQFVGGYNDSIKKVTFATQTNFQPFVDDIQVVDAWVDAKGYRMSDSALQQAIQFFSSNPFTIRAQKCEVNQFPSGPEASGLRTSMNVRLNHVTDIEILHPTDSRQRTVFRNIMADNYQIQIGNRRYPDQLTSTISPQFHEQQIQASDFDSLFEANDEYEHSLTDPSIEELSDGRVIKLKPYTDNTSFVPIFQTERSGFGSSMWFDGLDSITEKVEITCTPLFAGRMDAYYQTGGITPNPILVTTSESYWIFRLVNGVPNCQYVVSHTYEEGFNDHNIEAV